MANYDLSLLKSLVHAHLPPGRRRCSYVSGSTAIHEGRGQCQQWDVLLDVSLNLIGEEGTANSSVDFKSVLTKMTLATDVLL